RNQQTGGFINVVIKAEPVGNNNWRIYSVRYAKNSRTRDIEYLYGSRVRTFLWFSEYQPNSYFSTWSRVIQMNGVKGYEVVVYRKYEETNNVKEIADRLALPWEVYKPPKT
ncbi:MAG: hypothetical protein DRR06_09245, partial [Gammaproteobacteria bacterium]